MSAAAQTKIFGMRIGVDPKILVGGLIVIAGLVFWYSSRGDDEGSAPASAVHTNATATAIAARPRLPMRRGGATGDRSGALRLRPVDATRGDVDPTLRLEMLIRLEFVKPQESSRNLFELGPGPTAAAAALAAHAPILMPKTLPGGAGTPAANAAPTFNAPLKYYGFVRAAGTGESNRGLFLDGDNVLVASEGEVLKQRYLVVELRDTSARLEDVQAKLGGTLPVVPVAIP